jgi:LuxR family maltose regulon positive regulatory protein
VAARDPASLERARALGEPEGYARIFGTDDRAGRSNEARPKPTEQGLIDPLSNRELDVLRLLASDLDGPAIARELVVSLNTVRTHTKHIYTKLDVNSRRSAVSRSRQLGLL